MAKKPKKENTAAPAEGTTPETVVPTAPASAPAAPAVPVVKDSKNGVTRPTKGTQTGNVWDIADKISAESGKPAERKVVVAAGTAAGINASTCTTQFGKWAKYHGYVGEKSPSSKPAGATPAPVVAQTAPAVPAVPVQETPEPFDVGYQAYNDHLEGKHVSNPYAAGTNEATAFTTGWNKAHEDNQNASGAAQ